MKKINHKISDEELLASYYQSRRTEYLGVLYERYMPLVYGVALKYLRDKADAEDAVMHIFEQLLSLSEEKEIRVFKAWLYACVRNFCLEELRKKTQNLSVTLDESLGNACDDFNLDEILEEEEKRKLLLKCIEALPEKQRISIGRFFMEDRSYKEIEESTGFSLKMVKSLIQNGKRNIKLCMERRLSQRHERK